MSCLLEKDSLLVISLRQIFTFYLTGFWKFAGGVGYDGGNRGGGGDSEADGTEAKTGAKERPLPVRSVARSLQASSEKSY